MTIKLSTHESKSSQDSKRILLVEDNDVNRMLLSDFLSYQGYLVKGLKDGQNFFSNVISFKPDIILMDLKLPGIDGYSLIKQLRNHPSFSNIPIIVVSAFAFKSDMDKAEQLGASYYFVKPINLNSLIKAIEEEKTINCQHSSMSCI